MPEEIAERPQPRLAQGREHVVATVDEIPSGKHKLVPIGRHGVGVYNVLEAETRGPFKGPRAYDATGLPLHFDNQSIFKERFFLDQDAPNILHDVITVIDHALTRPWTVDKKYVRDSNPRPDWRESNCVEGTGLVAIGKEMYVLRADGALMPAKKDQTPPDLSYFKK